MATRPGAHGVAAGIPGVTDDQVSETAWTGRVQPAHEPGGPRGPHPAERVCSLRRGTIIVEGVRRSLKHDTVKHRRLLCSEAGLSKSCLPKC